MLPQGFPERMLHLLGEAEFAEFLASYERPRSAGLRLNPRKPLPDGASLPFCEAQVPWEPNGYYVCEGSRPGLHPWHDAGAYYLQEPSAMAPARLLDAQPGERVLDLCAAPGGKTTQLAAAMQGRGLLVCNEIHPRRAQVLASNIERLGIPNALVLSEHPARLAQRFPGYFDRILVDAPCSGEGMFRKEEAAVTDWSEATVAMCAARQQEILASASGVFRRAGRGSLGLSGAAGLDRRSRAWSGACLPPLAALPARRGPLCRRPAQPCGRRTAGCSHGTRRSAPGSRRRLPAQLHAAPAGRRARLLRLRVLSGPGGDARPFRPARAARRSGAWGAAP